MVVRVKFWALAPIINYLFVVIVFNWCLGSNYQLALKETKSKMPWLCPFFSTIKVWILKGWTLNILLQVHVSPDGNIKEWSRMRIKLYSLKLSTIKAFCKSKMTKIQVWVINTGAKKSNVHIYVLCTHNRLKWGILTFCLKKRGKNLVINLS